ncbi:MAG TPA: hypothetical protein PKV27_11160, partial [Ilumatobacteraceae bacterium]|nr:hypothetical protein [Ilumatobacteraceae bacterium]
MRWTLRAMLAVGITAVSCLFTSGSALASAPNYGVITFEKVDQDGNLLGGAKIDGFSCTRSGNDNSWQCQSLNEYSWFDSTAGQTQPAWWDVELNGPYIPPTPPTSSLDLTGTTGASFTDDIPLRGTWALPIQHCLVLEEKAAPAGYQIRPGRSVFCAGPGGWTEANAVGFEAGPDRNASGGSWTVENVADSNGFPSSTTFRLMNTKSVTFDKRNETGELLAGGTFRAASCTWFDTPAVPAGDPDWSGGKQTPMFDDGYDQWHCAALDRSN